MGEDEVSFPWLRLLGALEAVEEPSPRQLMYEVKALQVFLQTPPLQALVGGADPVIDALPPAEVKKLVAAMRASPMISTALRGYLNDVYRRL
jgi:hypothetical protein